MKIAATTLGETAGDLLSMTLDVGYFLSLSYSLKLFFHIAPISTSNEERFTQPYTGWLFLTTSTAGTTISDYMDRTLGLGYAAGSMILLGILVTILVSWYFSEGSLSVSNIQSKKSELFYWMAILTSNTLGTALGDFLADDSGLGFSGWRDTYWWAPRCDCWHVLLYFSKSDSSILDSFRFNSTFWSNFWRPINKSK